MNEQSNGVFGGKVSRRNMLKGLGAVGGAAALSTVPTAIAPASKAAAQSETILTVNSLSITDLTGWPLEANVGILACNSGDGAGVRFATDAKIDIDAIAVEVPDTITIDAVVTF
jgi:anaerobic selenocysteine-containing dehydrogenase